MILSFISFIRTLIGFIDLMILTLVLYLLSFLPNFLLRGWYRPFFRYWCRVFIRALRCSLYLHQKNQYPLPKNYILISNHPSAFEDLGMSALFDVYYLAKEQLRHWWIFGRISQAAGTLYVKREDKDSRQAATQSLKMALEKGHNIGIYPEGGCKGRRIFIPFRYGAFDIARQTGIPIIPVFLHYESQEAFEWQDQHLLYKLWMIFWAQNRRVNYYLFDAIDPTLFPSKEALCEHVQQLYLKWQKQYLE